MAAGDTWVMVGCSPGTITAATEESGREASNLADLTRPDAPWESSSSSAAESYLVVDHGVAAAETSAVALLGGIWPASGLNARIRRAESDLLRSAVRLLPSVDVSRTNYDAADYAAIVEDPTAATTWSSPTSDISQAIQELDFAAWTADAATGGRRQQIWIALRRKSATYVETTTGPKLTLEVWDGVSAWVAVMTSAWIPAIGVYSVRFDASVSGDISSAELLRLRITVDPGASDTLEVGGVALVPDYDDHVYDSGWVAAAPAAPRLVADDEELDDAHYDQRPASTFLHPFTDAAGVLERQASRYTILEFDPTLVPETWADAAASLDWQHVLGGLTYAARQLWAVYWEGPGIAGAGLRQGVRAEPVDRGESSRAIEGTAHTIRRITSDRVQVTLLDLPAEVVSGVPAVGVEAWEILERAGEVFPVALFMVPWGEDVSRIFSAVGVVSGARMTLATRKADDGTNADALDVSFNLTTIGGR